MTEQPSPTPTDCIFCNADSYLRDDGKWECDFGHIFEAAALAASPSQPSPALDRAIAVAARDFAGYVPFSRLRKGGKEAWQKLRHLLDDLDPDFYDDSPEAARRRLVALADSTTGPLDVDLMFSAIVAARTYWIGAGARKPTDQEMAETIRDQYIRLASQSTAIKDETS